MIGVSFVSRPVLESQKPYKGQDNSENLDHTTKTTSTRKDDWNITNSNIRPPKPKLESLSDSSVSSQSSEVSELKKRNKHLEEENQSLKIEMEDFEIKLSYLEYALGVVDGDDSYDSGFMASQKKYVEEITNSSIKSGFEDGDGEKLNEYSGNLSELSDDRKEIEILRLKNEKMVTAMKALAKAALTQTDKHKRYKNKSSNAKKEVSKINKKMLKILQEKRKAHESLLTTRNRYFEEQSKKEELQNEIKRLSSQLRYSMIANEVEDVKKRRTLQKLEEEIGTVFKSRNKIIPGVSSNAGANVESRSTHLLLEEELVRKSQIMVQLQSKVNTAKEYLKKTMKKEAS